jgi:hypothetical protein
MEIVENISEVDNKIWYTLQEETNMNRKVMFNIISEIVILTLIQCVLISYIINNVAGEPYYIIVIQIISCVPDICNTIFLFQFVNLVLLVDQRYSHLNKRLNNWITVTVSKQKSLIKGNEMCIRHDKAVDNLRVYTSITPVSVSSDGYIEGSLKQTDINSLRKIYSELYDISCLINNTYGVPILVTMCWWLTGILCSLFEVLIDFNVWGVANTVYAITCSLLFFNVTLLCHTATNEARCSRILVQKLLIEGKFRTECVNLLKMLSVQLQVMKIEYTACGLFTLNLRLFVSVVSVIASYIIIMVQIK